MRKRATWAAAIALAATMIAACGSSADNGVASKSPDAIVSSAKTAVEGVKSLHIYGTVESGSPAVTLDLHLVAGTGARGQVSQSGLSFRLISLGHTIYISGGPAFWQRFGGAGAAQLLQGKWLKASIDSADFASFAHLTNLHDLVDALLTGHGKLTRGTTTTIRGQRAVTVHDATMGGTLYVATTGKPYPLEIVSKGGTPGQTGGHLSLDRFNEAVSLSAPANSIDLTKLTQLQ